MHPLVLEGKIPEIPFWSEEFLEKECKVIKVSGPRAIHRGVELWLEKHGQKFTKDQTLILDSLTFVGNAIDRFNKDNPIRTKRGEEDSFAAWNMKNLYMIGLHRIIRGLSCNFISIVHELPDYDEDGKVCGLKPMITGSFKDQLAGSYTESWRQIVEKQSDKTMKFKWRIKPSNMGTYGGLNTHCVGVETVEADFPLLLKMVEEGREKLKQH
jgi:hypothetical protein